MDELGFNRVDDYVENQTTTGTVPVNGSSTGTINVALDHDWFATQLIAGHNYTLRHARVPEWRRLFARSLSRRAGFVWKPAFL
jgi:hypothetical protein